MVSITNHLSKAQSWFPRKRTFSIKVPTYQSNLKIKYQSNLKIPNTKLEAYRRSIQFQGAVICNKLPMERKTETSLLRFKIKLGEHFNS